MLGLQIQRATKEKTIHTNHHHKKNISCEKTPKKEEALCLDNAFNAKKYLAVSQIQTQRSAEIARVANISTIEFFTLRKTSTQTVEKLLTTLANRHQAYALTATANCSQSLPNNPPDSSVAHLKATKF